MNDEDVTPDDEGTDEGAEETPETPETPDAPDMVKVVATLLDGETDEFMVRRGSTLLDLSRQLHLPDPAKRVATDEDDNIITPDFVFTEDVTHICYVLNAKGGVA
jgi:hypothetical protein